MASEDGQKREELDPFIQDEEREDGLACLHLPPSLARSWFMWCMNLTKKNKNNQTTGGASLSIRENHPPSLLLNLPVVSLSLSQNRFSFFSPFLPLSYQLAFF